MTTLNQGGRRLYVYHRVTHCLAWWNPDLIPHVPYRRHSPFQHPSLFKVAHFVDLVGVLDQFSDECGNAARHFEPTFISHEMHVTFARKSDSDQIVYGSILKTMEYPLSSAGSCPDRYANQIISGSFGNIDGDPSTCHCKPYEIICCAVLKCHIPPNAINRAIETNPNKGRLPDCEEESSWTGVRQVDNFFDAANRALWEAR